MQSYLFPEKHDSTSYFTTELWETWEYLVTNLCELKLGMHCGLTLLLLQNEQEMTNHH